MITGIITAIGALFGSASIWGLLLKAGAWLGARWVTAAAALPLLGPLSLLCERLVDFLFWGLKGLARRLVRGADHISQNVYSAALLILLVALAWKFGPGDWRFWARTTEPPPGMAAPAKSSPNSPTPRAGASRCTDPLSACWWDNLLR